MSLVMVLITFWWVLLAVMAWAVCRAAGRADEAVARWNAERVEAREALLDNMRAAQSRTALERMGDDADELWS